MQGKLLSSTACRSCSDVRDIVSLSSSQHLFLKPIARMNISVQLPQLKTPDKSISSWEVMERLRKMAKPEKFSVLKVTKNTLEFIRFEGEIDSKDKLKGVIERLDMKTIKLSGFSESLKVRAAEAKMPFPTRHVWDSFFREAKNMDEMKPGERPDTIHLSNLPCKWFTLPELQEKEPKPSEYIFQKVFEYFGEVRYVDVPCIDPYRARMKNKSAGIKTFSFDDGVMFEGFVQFKEYVGFLKAMSALKGMLLMFKDKDRVLVAPIKVDFDRTKHMTDHSIKRRHVERERLIQQDAELLNKERKFIESVEAKRDKELREKEAEKLDSLLEEEGKIELKKKLEMEKIKKAEKQRKKIKKKLAEEEHKLKMAQAKLENVELLEILLQKAKKKQKLKKNGKKKKKKKEKEKSSEPISNIVDQVVESVKEEESDLLVNRELELRKRLLLKYKRNLVTQLAPPPEDEKEPESASIVDATIAEINAQEEKSEQSNSEDEDSDSETSESESIQEEIETTVSKSAESESEGEIKSDGEVSDSDISVKSEKPTSERNDSKKEESSVSKVGSHVEVVSNHWKSTTRHYTDRDGKRRGDTWIEGKQVYEIGSGGVPPWALPSDFYSGRRADYKSGGDAYDKYFEKFNRRRRGGSKECHGQRRRSGSREMRGRRRTPSRERRGTSSRERRRTFSRERKRTSSRERRRRSRSRSRNRSSSSLSLSRSRSRSPNPNRKPNIEVPKSPLNMKISKVKKIPKVTPVKSESNVRQRPKPLIMKMPSKRPKKVPTVAPPVVETPVIPEIPVPEQIFKEEKAPNSPILELDCSPCPIPTDSIPLPDSSPDKEVPLSVQEVPVFDEAKPEV